MYYDEEGAVESLSNSNDERSWEKKYCNCIAVDKQDMLKLCSGEMKEVNSTWYSSSTGSEFSLDISFTLLFLSLSISTKLHSF